MRIGDYELVRLLGRGGMGDVWLATETRAERPVALKFIKPYLLQDPGFLTRFLNEARTLGRLDHDRIVTLFAVLEKDGHLALVLRFIDGRSLADVIDEQRVVPLAIVMACARDVVPALGSAHEKGIIHRDIKPQNILVDRSGRSFLTDFGIAVVDFADRGTVTGFSIGTPHYMSPEQIQTPREVTMQHGGYRSDIYSFGVVLFEMLTGRLPFGANTSHDDIYRIQNAHCVEAPPRLRDINPDVTPAVEEVVLRCLAKSPADRPQSCAELLQLLESAAAGTAPAARPRAERAATIVERSGAIDSGTPAAPARPSPRVAKGVPQQVPKLAWFALGAVLIAGGIGYAVLTRSSPVPDPNKKETIVDPPPKEGDGKGKTDVKPPGPGPDRGPGPGTDPKVAQAETRYKEAQAKSQQGMYCDAQQAASEAVRLSPSGGYQRLQAEMAQKCNSTQGAEMRFNEARALGQQGRACEGKAKADEAINLNPGRADFGALREQLASACGADELAKEAEALFQQGEYCAAQAKMDQAMGANSAGAQKYRPRREVMAKGCSSTVR